MIAFKGIVMPGALRGNNEMEVDIRVFDVDEDPDGNWSLADQDIPLIVRDRGHYRCAPGGLPAIDWHNATRAIITIELER